MRCLAFICLLFLTASCGPVTVDNTLKFQGASMGTTWSVTLRELPPGQTPESIEGRVVETLENIEGLASHWREDSQLSRFNSSRETVPVSVNPHLHRMLTTAMELHEKTGGAYDVTIAPLVDLWGFGPGGEPAVMSRRMNPLNG